MKTWSSDRRDSGGQQIGSALKRWTVHVTCASALAWGGITTTPMGAQSAVQQRSQTGEDALRIEKLGTSEASFHVVSALIVGPTESILWDAQYRVSDGERLAEEIAATGTRLKAIVLSHADHDHYMGATSLLVRFPGTPVYMTQSGLDDYVERSPRDFGREQRRGGPEVPDSIVRPELIPSGGLEVDGRRIEIIEGLAGDVRGRKNAALWIPSIRTVLAADLVFEGIHPWLGDSDVQSRVEWRESLRRLSALDPLFVVPGHKRDLSTPDSPHQMEFMLRYLDHYDAFMREATEPDEMVQAMVEKYSDLALPGLMAYGARTWFKR